MQKHDKKTDNSLLAEIVKKNPQYANLLIADRSGLLWAAAIPAKGPVSYSDRRYFTAALASGNLSSGEYGISRTLNKPVMNYGYPIKDASGRITDVVIVAFTLEKYDRLLNTGNLPEKTSLLLTDHKGTILFVPTVPELVGRQDRAELLRLMTAGGDEGTFESESNTGVRRVFSYRKLYLGGEQTPYMYVRAGVAVETVLAKTRKALLFNLGLMSTVLLLVMGFALFICKRSYPELVHPEEKVTGDERMKKLITGEVDHVHSERLYLRRDGTSFWGYLSGRRHEDADGNWNGAEK